MNNVPKRPSLLSVQSDNREWTQKRQSIIFRLQNFKTKDINRKEKKRMVSKILLTYMEVNTYIQRKMTNIFGKFTKKKWNSFEMRSFVHCEEKPIHSHVLETMKLGQMWKELYQPPGTKSFWKNLVIVLG